MHLPRERRRELARRNACTNRVQNRANVVQATGSFNNGVCTVQRWKKVTRIDEIFSDRFKFLSLYNFRDFTLVIYETRRRSHIR